MAFHTPSYMGINGLALGHMDLEFRALGNLFIMGLVM
jgi:hypothetical protein